MAVSVNTVYQTVLYILNKEQRGYITPAEFNSLAAQVQDEIFQSYFPDGNQVNRLNQNNTQNDTEFFNMFKDISYKLHPFERELSFTYNSSNECFYNNTGSILFKIGDVVTTYSGQPQYSSVTQLVSKKDFDKITRSKLTFPTKQYPIFRTTSSNNLTADISLNSGGAGYVNGSTHGTTGGTGTGFNVTVTAPAGIITSITVNDYGSGYSAGDILTINGGTTSGLITITPLNKLALKISPNPSSVLDTVSVNCILRPTNPVWGFTTGSVGQYIFTSVGATSSSSVDFELDTSEQTNLIIGILKYCGIIVKDPLVIQAASQEAQAVEANEKS
jgi:hypothetical protein